MGRITAPTTTGPERSWSWKWLGRSGTTWMRAGWGPETGGPSFLLLSGPKQGLLGSCSYVYDAPAVPLAHTRAMMNFDMVGRLRSNTIYISGAETSGVWNPLVNNSNEPTLSLAISESSCTGCTDHVCFWQAGIPFVGFFTGLHEEYHGPDDDVDLIDFSGMSRIGALALRALNRLVVMPEAPPLTGTYPASG